jgi:hypothetical protein
MTTLDPHDYEVPHHGPKAGANGGAGQSANGNGHDSADPNDSATAKGFSFFTFDDART